MPSKSYDLSSLQDGDYVTGFDFGRSRDHVVACRIRVDSGHVDGFRITEWGSIDFGYKTTLVNAIEGLRDAIDQEAVFCANYFLLERQYPKNAFCYALSHVLYYALLLRGSDVAHVKIVAPASKFDVLNKIDTEDKNKRRKGYRADKMRAVRLCNQLTQNQRLDITKEYRRRKKKDDFADAFLYARAFFEANHTPSRKVRETSTEKEPCEV